MDLSFVIQNYDVTPFLHYSFKTLAQNCMFLHLFGPLFTDILMWTILNVFIELVTILLLSYLLCFFGLKAYEILPP